MGTGVPATVLHASSNSTTKRNETLTVAQTVADIITAKDGLALGQTAVDEIQVIIDISLWLFSYLQILFTKNDIKIDIISFVKPVIIIISQ